MGLYQNIRKLWKKPQAEMPKLWSERLISWRREPTTIKIERPTRIDRARSLGYKAKQGFVVVRQRVPRGGHKRPMPKKGRRSKRYHTRLDLKKSYQVIAQERAAKKYANLTVLNSYWVAQDGKYYWYEIIFVDPNHPVIKSDPKMNWTAQKKHHSRAYTGKTSAGKKSRGLTGKGKGYEKARPSQRSNLRKH